MIIYKNEAYKMKSPKQIRIVIKRRLDASFWSGAGSVLSVRGRHVAVPSASASRDAKAIAGDWQRVGGQLWMAVSAQD